MTESGEGAKELAEILCRYLSLSRAAFGRLAFVPPLRPENFEKELLAGKRTFYGVEVAFDAPVIRADAEHNGFFLEYVWRGGFQNRLRTPRNDDPDLVERAKAMMTGLKRTGPLGGDGFFQPINIAHRKSKMP